MALPLTGGAARGQAIEELRPSDLLEPAQDDIAAEPPAEVAAPARVEPPAEDEEPVIRRRRVPPEDPYAPQGMAAGALRLYPVLQSGAILSSNPRQRNGGSKAGLGLRLAPSFRLESDWVRHSLRLNGSAEIIDYPSRDIPVERTANLTLAARIDVRRTTFIDFDANYDYDRTGAEDSEVPDTAEGDRVEHELGGFAALNHTFGRLTLRGRSGARLKLFEDVQLAGGGIEDNADRNYVEPELALRATYETSPALKPFADVAYRPRLHLDTPDRNGFDRDSQGGQLRLGAQFDASPLWSGELAMAYTVRDYDDPALGTIGALGIIGNVVWRPTELTTITASANSSIDETVAAGSGGTRTYEARLEAEHELRENILLVARTGIEFDQRDGPDDLTFDAGIGVTYRFNPWLAWTAGYGFTSFDGGAPQSDYVEHRVTTGIEIRR
jgi:hypothetical protein